MIINIQRNANDDILFVINFLFFFSYIHDDIFNLIFNWQLETNRSYSDSLSDAYIENGIVTKIRNQPHHILHVSDVMWQWVNIYACVNVCLVRSMITEGAHCCSFTWWQKRSPGYAPNHWTCPKCQLWFSANDVLWCSMDCKAL